MTAVDRCLIKSVSVNKIWKLFIQDTTIQYFQFVYAATKQQSVQRGQPENSVNAFIWQSSVASAYHTKMCPRAANNSRNSHGL
jgi:hypothetical protein